MESRTVSAIVVVLFIGIDSHIASSQRISSPPIPCNATSDCEHPYLPAGAKCISGSCICANENGIPYNCMGPQSQPKAAVRRPVTAAHVCTLDQDCQQLPNGFCNTTVKQCVCSEGFVMASASYNCLPISRSVGSSCDQDEQCSISNSTCRSGQCVCSPGFHYSENGCWRTVEIGKSCVVSQECSRVSNAICNDQLICACAHNSVLNSDRQRCLLVVKRMLEPCVESVQCSKAFTDAECIDKRCECKENNHFERSLSGCVSSKHLGDSCSSDHECYQDQEGGESEKPQSCIGSVCTCNENFRKDGDKCVSSGASTLGPFVYVSVLLSALLFSRS